LRFQWSQLHGLFLGYIAHILIWFCWYIARMRLLCNYLCYSKHCRAKRIDEVGNVHIT
jgi:hypothetical protein